MPWSTEAEELAANSGIYYGDPCYAAQWGSTFNECKDKTKFGNLALMVLDEYDIPISPDSDSGYETGSHVCCCPLDILVQDPLQVMNMSLQSKLLDMELWECYADEYGNARFVRVLEGSSESSVVSPLPRVHYCVPTISPNDIANIVIVQGADGPPFRKCGEWIDIVSSTTATDLRSSPPSFDNPESAEGIRFTWGEVTGHGGRYVEPTCEDGTFNDHGCIIYPDFERKSVYKDGITDVFEIEAWETVLFWLVDFRVDASVDEKYYEALFYKF
jgi:hypothetical protein